MEETSLKTKVIYVLLSIAISAGGIYWMVAPLNQKANDTIRAGLESPTYGPFDEALAKSAGMEDILKNKPKWKPPEVSPVDLTPDWVNDGPLFKSILD